MSTKNNKNEKLMDAALKISKGSFLNVNDIYIILTLMQNSKMTNADLADLMGFKDGNAVAYHLRNMQNNGIIGRYTLIPNWRKMGLTSEFIIVAEANSEEQLLEIEKMHVSEADDYSSRIGPIVVTPTIAGCVIIENIYHCFGDRKMALIIGRASSDQDAAIYCKNYLVKKYPGIKLDLMMNKYRTVNEYFIDKEIVETIKGYFQMMGEPSEVMKSLEDMKH